MSQFVFISQGDDSLSVITCESDAEMVSCINDMLQINALKRPLRMFLHMLHPCDGS